MTRVRVGIVSWNTAHLLDRCLEALPAALDGVEAEIVVVDNASDDGSADVALGHAGVRLLRNHENVGYARAMNQALAGGGVEVLIALNPDTEPSPGSLSTLVKRLLDDPSVGLVVPKLVNPDGTLQHSVARFPSSRQVAMVLLPPAWVLRRGVGARWWADGYAPHDRPVDIDWAIGAVHVIRAEAVDGSPYDERWFMYVEDVDLCWKLAQRGWRRRLEPDVEVVHVGNAAGEQAWGGARTERWVIATYDWYARTFGRAAMRRWAAVHTLAVLAFMIRALPGAAIGRSSNRARLRELWRVLPLQVRPLLRGTPGPARGIGGPPVVTTD